MAPNRPLFTIPGFRWRGFTLQFFLLTFLPLTILTLATAFGALSLHRRAMRSLVGDRDLLAAYAIAASLQEKLNKQTFQLQTLASSIEESDQTDDFLSYENLSSSFDGGVSLYTQQGQVIAPSQPVEYWVSLPSDLPVFWTSIIQESSDHPIYSQAINLPDGKTTVMFVGMKLSGDEVLVGAFSPSVFIGSTLQGISGNPQIFVLVVDQENMLLYQNGVISSHDDTKPHAGIEDALRGESGVNYINVSGDEHVLAFTPVQPVGWGLVIEESWEDISTPYLLTTQSAPLVIIPLLVLALIALWFSARQIVQPLQALEKKAADLAAGDFASIRQSVGGIAEIRHLQEELSGMAERLNIAQESLHNYIGAITASAENERHNLARELHDGTLQTLIALNQRIHLDHKEQLKNTASPPDDLQQLVQQTIINLRRTVRGLRPIYLEDLGLAAALEMLADETRQNTEIPIHFQIEGSVYRLAPEEELALYRIAQETLSNVTRHAQAKQAWLEIHFSTQQVRLVTRDDGQGFETPSNPAEFARQGHYGLLGLNERTELMGANLKITSVLGKGTQIEVTLPRNDSKK